MKENSKALLYTAIAIASWSTVASAFKIGLRHYGAFELILVSAITATLLFAGVLTFQRKWHLLKGLNRRELGSYAFTGLLNPALYYLILFRSYDLLPAQVAQPINYFWPILLALQKSSNPALTNQLCYLSPFISLFLIHAVVGETIYLTTYLGLLLIVSGILLNEYLRPVGRLLAKVVQLTKNNKIPCKERDKGGFKG